MRLIDADMARDILLHKHRIDFKEYPKEGFNYRVGLEQGIELMEKAPTVDAVPMSVIEDIKAEIDEIAQGHNPTHDPFDGGYTMAIMDVLNIIDKHCGKESE